jgi:hypothetical protein
MDTAEPAEAPQSSKSPVVKNIAYKYEELRRWYTPDPCLELMSESDEIPSNQSFGPDSSESKRALFERKSQNCDETHDTG